MIEAKPLMSNPNVNCLDGKRCPECGSFGPFELVVSLRILLRDCGTDDAENSSPEYGEDTRTVCHSCNHEGQFADFEDHRA
jgi:hypothetical protein